MTCVQMYFELYERCLKTSMDMHGSAEKLGKIADSEEKLKARTELEGLLNKNDEQLDRLEDISSIIIADESLQQEISKHYKFPLDATPAIISGRLQNLTDSYVRINLSTISDDFKEYVQQKTGQTCVSC